MGVRGDGGDRVGFLHVRGVRCPAQRWPCRFQSTAPGAKQKGKMGGEGGGMARWGPGEDVGWEEFDAKAGVWDLWSRHSGICVEDRIGHLKLRGRI